MASELGPIEAATAGLRDWLTRVSGGPVRIGPPDDADQAGLSLWPYELRPERQTTGTGARHPYRFAVRYVVAGGLGALDRVLTEAVRTGEPVLSQDRVDWSTAGVAPRPVLVFDVPAMVSHPAPDTPLVRGPLVLKQGEPRPLVGEVRDQGGQPLTDVRVEVAGTPLATYTDRHGTFTLAGIPAGLPGGDHVGLRLSGRGRTFTADVDLTDSGPVVIHCAFAPDN